MSLYYKLLPLANKVSGSFSNMPKTCSSILRMMLCSKISIAVKSKGYRKLKLHDDCTILGNGPSLKAAMESGEVRLNDADVICVNYFCESEYFQQIKPRFYFLIDPEFFHPTNEITLRQLPHLIDVLNQADWDIFVCIPATVKNGGIMHGVNNPHVKFLRFNSTTCNGWAWFKNLMYDWRLGMPQCMNVVNFGTMAAINMRYKNIYMYGIDHTFSAQVFVGDDNYVYTSDKHFYGQDSKAHKMEGASIATVLSYTSKAFISHEQLEKYSHRVGVKIYNCTRGSFVDAYERLYPQKIKI